VAAAAEGDQGGAEQLGQRGAAGVGPDRVVVAVDHQHRAAHLGADRLQLLPGGRRAALHGADQRLRGGLQAPADHVLALLGGMRLGEHLAGEELEEVAVLAQPVVTVELGPALGGVELILERVDGARVPGGVQRRHGRIEQDRAEHPAGVGGGQLHRPTATAGQAGNHRPVGADRVQHGDRVGHELTVGVGLGLGRPVGAAVATAVEGDHPEVARQIGHLRLPVPGVDD
jgi:hypothetical protein